MHGDVQLVRILTVVNSRLASENAGLKLWFDACVRFSDVVLLNKRTGVPNKWISDYRQRFEKKECYPCLFVLVKEGHVSNPAEILYPEARRMSLAFDFLDEESAEEKPEEAEEVEYEIVDETGDDEQPVEEDEEDDKIEPEPFFARDVAGRRRIRLPDISGYIK